MIEWLIIRIIIRECCHCHYYSCSCCTIFVLLSFLEPFLRWAKDLPTPTKKKNGSCKSSLQPFIFLQLSPSLSLWFKSNQIKTAYLSSKSGRFVLKVTCHFCALEFPTASSNNASSSVFSFHEDWPVDFVWKWLDRRLASLSRKNYNLERKNIAISRGSQTNPFVSHFLVISPRTSSLP